jgi:phosphate transport system substrate-binding protein
MLVASARAEALSLRRNEIMIRRFFLIRFFGLFVSVFLWIVACQPSPETGTDSPTPSTATTTVVLNGTGADFPFFIYQRWFSEYSRLHPNVQINYQPTGSAVGIQQIVSETIDFGASDIAMTDDEMAQVSKGVVLLPMTAGGVAVAYNLPGVDQPLQLSRQVLAEIFLGTITQWNDPKLAAVNPEVTLPDLPIVLVHRSDGSGTTATFTAHLSAISSEWQAQVGSGLSVEWPTGAGVKSNAGVSAQIQQAEGAIGYVEYGYAQKLGLAIAALENQAGQYVQPNPDSVAAALSRVQLPENLRAFAPDPQGADAYPIVTYSWILAYERYDDPNKAAALKDVVQWSLTEGQQFSEELGYVPLFPQVVEKASAAAEKIAS